MGNNLYSNLVNFYNVNDENFKEFMAEIYKEMLTTHRDVQYVKEHLTEEIEKIVDKYLVDGNFNINIEEKVNEFLENNQEIKNITAKLNANTNNIENITSQLDTIVQQQNTIIIRGKNITVDIINNALEQAQQKRIYNVFLPNREEPYLIDKEIMIKSNIRFYSNGATLKPSGNLLTVNACPMIRNFNIGASEYNGDYNITIEGFVIDCNITKVTGIGLAHTNNCKIINNKIINTLAPSHGMDLVCNKDLIVENNYLQNCPQGGVQIDGSLEGSLPALTNPILFVDNIGSKNIKIINNRFYNCKSGAIHLHKTRHENIAIDSNIFEQCDGCIVDDNNYNSSHQNVVIKNNSFIDSVNMSCIVFYAGHNKLNISDNKFINVKNAIILDKNLDNNNKYNDLIIANNIFDTVNKNNIVITNGYKCVINSNIIKEYGTTDTTEYYAINLVDSNYVTISDNDIYIVTGEKTDRIAIKNNDNCSNLNLNNNNIIGCKIAWLGGVNTQYVEITSNTIRNCGLQALKCESFSTTLKNIVIQNNTIDTTGDNAIRFANIQGGIINGNIIRNYPDDKRGISLNTGNYSNISNNHITGLNYGISISSASATDTTGINIITGNVLNGNTIELLNGTRDNIVTNNIIKGKTLSLDESNNIVTNNRIVS